MKPFNKYFIENTRMTGQTYTCLSDEAPVALQEFIREVHKEFDCMPNDWIYSKILKAFESEEPDLREAFIEPDIWTVDLIEWTTNSFAHGLLDEALEQSTPFKSYFSLLSYAQYEAIQRINFMVQDFLDKNEKEAE